MVTKSRCADCLTSTYRSVGNDVAHRVPRWLEAGQTAPAESARTRRADMASGTNGERRVRLKPDARKNLILREAARLFYARGYHDTSLQDIADAAGLQKGS